MSQQNRIYAEQQGNQVRYGGSTQGNTFQNQSVVKSGRVQVFQDVPKYVEREVEVEYEVLIERPVENVIENRYYVDKEIEVPITHVTEVDVEVVREVKKYIPVERKVEYETIREKPYEKIIEVPIEIVKEIPVAVERIVNVNQERTTLRPHRSEIRENPIYVDKEVRVDKIVERFVDVDVPVYVDKITEKYVNVPEYIYRDVVHEVPRYVDVPRDVYYDKIVEVPKERIVEKEIVVDRIVEKPYTVERIVEKKREVPVERIVEVPVYFDKIVEVPVEKRVEVPYKVQRHVKKIVPRQVNVPLISTKDVEIPFERIIDEPYEVIEEVPYPVEKVVERTVDVPVYNEEQVFDYIEIEVPYEKIVEVPVYQDKEIIVEIIREKFVEVPYEKIVDRVVEVEKIIEKPIYNQKIVERPVQKIVEKRVEVPIEKYVEIPRYREVQKRIRVEHKAQRSSVVEKKNSRSMRKSVKTSTISTSQKTAYISLGEGLSKYKIENLKLSLDVKSLQQQIGEYRKIAQNPELFKRENEELKKKIVSIEQTISSVKSENTQLEHSTILTKETQMIDAYSSNEVAKLESEVRLLIEKNQKLSNILNGLGESTTVTNTAYIQRTMNEGTKIAKVQSNENWISSVAPAQTYTTTTQYVTSVEQPKVSVGTAYAKTGNTVYEPTRVSYGNREIVQGQDRVSYASNSGVRVQNSSSVERRSIGSKYVTNIVNAPVTTTTEVYAKEPAKYTTTTETYPVSSTGMKTVFSTDYQNARPLDSYVNNTGRKSLTTTIIGEPQIRTSNTYQTTTVQSVAPQTTTSYVTGNQGTAYITGNQGTAYITGNQGTAYQTSQVFQTQTGTRIVEPTKIVTSNRIVESTNRGNLFSQVKSGTISSQTNQARVITDESNTAQYKTVTSNFANNPYLNSYVQGTKKY
jgi:hypothetical protein